MIAHLAWWVLHIIGADDLGGPWYAVWSGVAGDTGLFAVFGVLWHHHRATHHKRKR